MLTGNADLLEQLQRQLYELEALQAVFPDGDGEPLYGGGGGCGGGGGGTTSGPSAALLFSHLERQALELARQLAEAAQEGAPVVATTPTTTPSTPDPTPTGEGNGGEEGLLAGLPLLSGTVRPPGLQYGGQPVALRFTLPRAYPGGARPQPPPPPSPSSASPLPPPSREDREGGGGGGAAEWGGGGGGGGGGAREALPQYRYRRARLLVECGGPRHVHERLGAVVARVAEAEAEAGCECLLLAVDALRDAVEQLEAVCCSTASATDEAAGEGVACASAGGGGGGDGCGLDANGDCGDNVAKGVRVVDAPSSASSSAPSSAPSDPEGLLCILVWLHHLKSVTKRKLIVQWARELGLAGACKPGFPGVIVVEGYSSDVREFQSRMRALSWQALQVRGQDLLPLPQKAKAGAGPGRTTPCPTPSAPASTTSTSVAPLKTHGGSGTTEGSGARERVCTGGGGGGGSSSGSRAAEVEGLRRLRAPLPFCELDETGGMSELGTLCRAAGLHHVFMTALKL